MVLTNVILPVFFIIFLGFLLRKYGKVDLRAFSRAQLYLLSPALVFMSLASAEAETGLILRVLLFIVCMQAVILGVSLGAGFVSRRDRAERQAIAISSVFVNSGFYGIPVCMLAFGQWGLVYGTIYMVASSITQSTTGVFLASAGRQGARQAFASIFKVPLIYAIVAARILVHFNALPPEPFMKMITMLGQAAIPLGLILLGMQLERIVLEWSIWRNGAAAALDLEEEGARAAACAPGDTAATVGRDVKDGAAAAALRIAGGFAVSYGLVHLFDFGPNMNQVLILQSSMPTAVNMVVYATEWNCRPRIVAVAILASTLASMASIPIILRVIGG